MLAWRATPHPVLFHGHVFFLCPVNVGSTIYKEVYTVAVSNYISWFTFYLQKGNDFFHNCFNLAVQLLSINSRTRDSRNVTYRLWRNVILSNGSFYFLRKMMYQQKPMILYTEIYTHSYNIL